MSKSGLADSPFFAPQTKTVATPPSRTESEVPTKEDSTNYQPQSPTTLKAEEINLEAQNENKQDQKRTNVLSDVRTNERPYDGTNERPNVKPKRQKIRHAFDIYQDQLFALQMKQLEAVQRGKRKPKLGKMVQDAIDLFLKQSGKTNKSG
jgi:hypothetical protein